MKWHTTTICGGKNTNQSWDFQVFPSVFKIVRLVDLL